MADAPLPGVLAEVETVAGREAALGLALALGGQSIHVPRPENLHADHPLAVAAGAGAGAIVEYFAGESVYVPHARSALVLHLTEIGHGTRQIAARLGISPRAVRQHRRRQRGSVLPSHGSAAS